MNNIHINNSYNVWKTSDMRSILTEEVNFDNPEAVLNRSYRSIYIEWWLHNIGYYVTKPFCFINKVNKTNLRFKDVDLEEWL